MLSLLVARTAESASELAAVFRGEGLDLDVHIGSLSAPPAGGHPDYVVVFLERTIGVEAIRAACQPFASVGPFPLIAVLGAEPMTSAQGDELMEAGVGVQLGGESPGLACRVRFLKRALEKRSTAMSEVRASEERYRTVIAALDEGLVVQDHTGKVTEMNPRAGEILGMTDDGVRDRVWRSPDWELLRADGSVGGPADLPGIKALVAGGAVRGYVVGARKKPDGQVAWISANSHVVRDESGENIVGVVTSFSDITERRRAEDEFHEILERTPDAVFIHRAARCVWVSKTFADLLGYDAPRALLGVSVLSFVDPHYRDLIAERLRLREHASESLPALEIPLLRNDGSLVDVAISGVPTMYDGQRATICFTRDRTAQRRLEMELMATERLAALGRLAAGVGHEINNPLAYVMGNLAVATERVRAGEDAQGTVKLLEEALDGAERIRAIVRDLRVFVTRKAEDLATVDVHRVIDSCARMADTEIRHRARFVRAFGAVSGVKANEARLAQVLLNLLVNAAHAIPEGRAHEATITVETRVEADGRVAIDVRDTGTGIAPEHLPHVFEPFFTTKG
ncbi:MAG: PAS domain S-box protein, partial [Polyangiaceae bacterium]